MTLVDTDVLVWYLRGNPNASRVIDGKEELCLSAVTYMELVQGMRNKGELRSLRSAMRFWNAELLHIDEAISARAMLYVERSFLSHSVRLADALIAATAVHHGTPLITGNAKHYRPIPGLTIEKFVP